MCCPRYDMMFNLASRAPESPSHKSNKSASPNLGWAGITRSPHSPPPAAARPPPAPYPTTRFSWEKLRVPGKETCGITWETAQRTNGTCDNSHCDAGICRNVGCGNHAAQSDITKGPWATAVVSVRTGHNAEDRARRAPPLVEGAIPTLPVSLGIFQHMDAFSRARRPRVTTWLARQARLPQLGKPDPPRPRHLRSAAGPSPNRARSAAGPRTEGHPRSDPCGPRSERPCFHGDTHRATKRASTPLGVFFMTRFNLHIPCPMRQWAARDSSAGL